jgi:nucleotide-binding universal stress UspA family protein
MRVFAHRQSRFRQVRTDISALSQRLGSKLQENADIDTGLISGICFAFQESLHRLYSRKATMLPPILVPLDGSTAAEHALPWAISIAQQEGTALHLVRVHVPPTPIMVGGELAADAVIDSTIRDIEAKYLADLSAQLCGVTTIPVHHALMEGGVADAIQDYARLVNAGLIAMTSHGRGAFARFWLGSAADAIIRHSTVPTLLVRPNDEQAADLTTRPFIHRIIIPLDGSPLAERIIPAAVQLGKAAGAEYALVLVLEAVENIEALAKRKIQVPGGWFPEATQAKAELYVEQVAHRMRGHSCIVHPKVILHGSAAGAILDYAQTNSHAVIALATHGRSGLKRLMLGSVADKIIRGATVPVLIYRPSETT